MAFAWRAWRNMVIHGDKLWYMVVYCDIYHGYQEDVKRRAQDQSVPRLHQTKGSEDPSTGRPNLRAERKFSKHTVKFYKDHFSFLLFFPCFLIFLYAWRCLTGVRWGSWRWVSYPPWPATAAPAPAAEAALVGGAASPWKHWKHVWKKPCSSEV